MILEVFGCESAGASLVTEDEERFYWPAIAGVWQPHIGGGTPRNFGPCGDVLDRNAPLLFKNFEPPVQIFPAGDATDTGVPAGSVLSRRKSSRHDLGDHPRSEADKFDNEDLRMLTSLGRFASSAYWAVESLNRLERHAR